ncbi:trigger factor [Candidatus Saccharibacteria bacterium]|nr:trigger factor [Candidatus Saccharibacteria bacterium]
MKTTIREISETRVEVLFELGKKELEDARLVSLKRLAGDVKVPGFRSGRAPANVVEKHVDPNVLAEKTLESAINKAVAKGFVEEKIQVLDRPAVEVKKYVPGDMLEFTAEAEVLPKIKLGDVKRIKVKAEKVTVSDEEMEEVLTNIRNGYAERKEVKRAAKNGDEVVIDFLGKKDGVEFDGGASKDYTLRLGSDSFIPGFEKGVVGKKAGEEFELKLKFPKDYHAEDLKGADVVFEVKLHAVKEVVVPELDAELAKKCGNFKSVKELKDDVKENLKKQKEHEAGEKLKDALVKGLVEISEVMAPDVLVEDQVRAIKRDMMQNLMYRGMNMEVFLKQVGKTEEEWETEEAKPLAEGRVKAGLVLAELSKEWGLAVSEEEVDAKLSELRDVYQKDAGAVEQLGTDQVRVDVRNRLLTEKTVDELVKRTGNAK